MKLLFHSNLKLTPEQHRELQTAFPGIDIRAHRVIPPDDLDGAGVEILVSDGVPTNLSQWPDLRWVQLLSAGANQLHGHKIWQTAIPITTASGTHGVPIAQFVPCTWLMMVHHMPELVEFKRSRAWPDRVALGCSTVRGMTVGIVGYGSIGRECARQLDALGMRVLCLKRDPASRSDNDYNAWPGTGDPQGLIPATRYGPGQLHEMLPNCDLVVVTAPSTPSTAGMMGAEVFARMKQTARLIVVSRGELVDEMALAAALRTGQLAEAVVDCYVREPLPPDHSYFDVPKLIMTPHMSGVYDGFGPAMITLIAENLRRFNGGLPLLNRADSQRGY